MEGMELKPQFDELQKIFDRCIKHACRVLEERIATKTARLDPEQRQEQERLEYNRIADELAELYLHHSVLSDLRFCHSEPAFLWEGGFFESLHADEKKKYLAFSVPSFDYSQYERDNTAYDAELPYFSAVVKLSSESVMQLTCGKGKYPCLNLRRSQLLRRCPLQKRRIRSIRYLPTSRLPTSLRLSMMSKCSTYRCRRTS